MFKILSIFLILISSYSHAGFILYEYICSPLNSFGDDQYVEVQYKGLFKPKNAINGWLQEDLTKLFIDEYFSEKFLYKKLKKGFNGLNNDQYSEVINTEFYYTGKAKKGLFSQTNDAFFFSENLLSRNNDGFMIHYIDRSNNFCGVHTSCKPSELVVYSCKL